jgi:hypothetical protein
MINRIVSFYEGLFYYFLSSGGGFVDKKSPSDSKAIFPMSMYLLLPLVHLRLSVLENLSGFWQKYLSDSSIIVFALLIWLANYLYFFGKSKRWKSIVARYEKMLESEMQREMDVARNFTMGSFILYLMVVGLMFF